MRERGKGRSCDSVKRSAACHFLLERRWKSTHTHTRTDRDAKSRILVIYSIVPVEGLSGCRRHLVMNRISFVSQHTIHPTVWINKFILYYPSATACVLQFSGLFYYFIKTLHFVLCCLWNLINLSKRFVFLFESDTNSSTKCSCMQMWLFVITTELNATIHNNENIPTRTNTPPDINRLPH